MSHKLTELKSLTQAKLEKSITLFTSSVDGLDPYDSAYNYSSQELMPYDALTSRFMRVYEMAIKFFKVLDLMESLHPSESLRDLIHNTSKLGFIQSEEVWFEMRIVRNQITHDYLPVEFKIMFDFITNEFLNEIMFLQRKIKT
ncbi:MAG: nucleotidyltransferase substrate binding protein [Saprospiraceae bacterium]|nr:nucleotidyltransferase substrate binding protein [Saprospiraceae bacterium]